MLYRFIQYPSVSGVHFETKKNTSKFRCFKRLFHKNHPTAPSHQPQRLGWGQGLQGHGFQVVAARIRSDAHLAAWQNAARKSVAGGRRKPDGGEGEPYGTMEMFHFVSFWFILNANLRYCQKHQTHILAWAADSLFSHRTWLNVDPEKMSVHKTRPKRQPGNLSIAQMKLERHGSEMQMLPFHINIDPETSILLAESHLLILLFF